MDTTKTEQLEISLTSRYRRRRRSTPACRLPRARWWFNQMHRAVDQAAEWPPAVATRAEQFALPLVATR